MVRLCCAAVLGCLLLAAQPALAQEGSKDDLKKLEADVAQLLQKIKGMTAKQEVKTPAAHWAGFGWLHFARMQDKTASCQKTQAQSKGKAVSEEKGRQSHWTGWARHGWHGSHWAGHHFWAMHWAGHHSRHESERSGTASVEQRLDHMMRELAALRHDLHKTK